MTIDIIGAVISVAVLDAPRRNPSSLLVDVCLADETRAGFRVALWLKADAQVQVQVQALASLRPGDVLLVKNVALAQWRGKVQGRSLGATSVVAAAAGVAGVCARDGVGAGAGAGALGHGNNRAQTQTHTHKKRSRKAWETSVRLVYRRGQAKPEPVVSASASAVAEDPGGVVFDSDDFDEDCGGEHVDADDTPAQIQRRVVRDKVGRVRAWVGQFVGGHHDNHGSMMRTPDTTAAGRREKDDGGQIRGMKRRRVHGHAEVHLPPDETPVR